jgi:hypothetical protein
MVDVKRKPVCLWCAKMAKEIDLKLTLIPMVGGAKLNLVLMAK